MDDNQNILDQVFSTPEEEVQTFMDVIKESVEEADAMREVVDGKKADIKAAELRTQQSGYIQITHGWHGEDYVWHICPFEKRKPWKASIERVCYATAQVMNEVIPQEIEVKMWLPYADWDIKEITFKAIGIAECWNVQEKDLRRMTLRLFEVLNTLL